MFSKALENGELNAKIKSHGELQKSYLECFHQINQCLSNPSTFQSIVDVNNTFLDKKYLNSVKEHIGLSLDIMQFCHNQLHQPVQLNLLNTIKDNLVNDIQYINNIFANNDALISAMMQELVKDKLTLFFNELYGEFKGNKLGEMKQSIEFLPNDPSSLSFPKIINHIQSNNKNANKAPIRIISCTIKNLVQVFGNYDFAKEKELFMDIFKAEFVVKIFNELSYIGKS